jgi:hypothetical protein
VPSASRPPHCGLGSVEPSRSATPCSPSSPRATSTSSATTSSRVREEAFFEALGFQRNTGMTCYAIDRRPYVSKAQPPVSYMESRPPSPHAHRWLSRRREPNAFVEPYEHEGDDREGQARVGGLAAARAGADALLLGALGGCAAAAAEPVVAVPGGVAEGAACDREALVWPGAAQPAQGDRIGE